jgi:osmotically-inducible protein OsmY
MNKKLQAISLAASLALSLSVVAVATTGCAGDRSSRSTGTYIDDKAVSTKVKTQLLTDSDVKGTEVRVRTYDGEVQLSGFVDSAAQKDRAVAIARAVPGVRAVKDDLIVKTVNTAQGTAPVQEPAGAQAPIHDNP